MEIDVKTTHVVEIETGIPMSNNNTDNYNSLTNKPQINGITLSENKTAEELGLASKEDVEELSNNKVDKEDGKGLSTNDYTTAEKEKLAGIDMSTKQDTLVSGTNIKTINNTSILGSGNIEISGSGSSLPIINVKDFGATGDGTTMDNRDFILEYLDRHFKRMPKFYGTIAEASEYYEDDIILITTLGHIVCSKYGIIYDTFDCSNREVEFIWRVK